MPIPKDPVILLSFINMQLRDNYLDLEDLCKSIDIDINELKTTLESIDYRYNKTNNQFI